MWIEKLPNKTAVTLITLLTVPPLMYFMAIYFHRQYTPKELNAVSLKNVISDMNMQRLNQDDPVLINFVKKYFILKPKPGPRVNRRVISQNALSPGSEMSILEPYVKYIKKAKFFIDAGSHDRSYRDRVPYWLERALGWSGIIIEPDSKKLSFLKAEKRNVWLVKAGVSRTPFAKQVNVNTSNSTSDFNSVNVQQFQYFPLYTILRAIKKTNVGYLGLDAQESAMDVLQTLPFNNKIQILIISVSFTNSVLGYGPLQQFLEQKNYKLINKTEGGRRYAVFVHRSLIAVAAKRRKIKPKRK